MKNLQKRVNQKMPDFLEHVWAMDKSALIALMNNKEFVSNRPDNLLTYTKDNVGFIHVYGSIFPKENYYTYFGYGSAIEQLTNDFSKLDNDPSIEKIVLLIDSPGGMINGVSDFVDQIKTAKTRTVSYVQNAFSAGYWIASAADKVVTTKTGMVGSIGVIWQMYKSKESDTITFVSSQSPYKNISPNSNEGASQYQAVVDSLANIFVSSVAANRDTTIENVLDNFGKGGIIVSYDAKEKGMIDSVESIETYLTRKGEIVMANKLDTVEEKFDVSALIKAEQERIKAIESVNALFNKLPSSIRDKVSSKINEMKFDATQTKDSVSAAILPIIAEAQISAFETAQNSRVESGQIASTLKSVDSAEVSEIDRGAALVAARKARIGG